MLHNTVVCFEKFNLGAFWYLHAIHLARSHGHSRDTMLHCNLSNKRCLHQCPFQNVPLNVVGPYTKRDCSRYATQVTSQSIMFPASWLKATHINKCGMYTKDFSLAPLNPFVDDKLITEHSNVEEYRIFGFWQPSHLMDCPNPLGLQAFELIPLYSLICLPPAQLLALNLPSFMPLFGFLNPYLHLE